mgnify:FL=1
MDNKQKKLLVAILTDEEDITRLLFNAGVILSNALKEVNHQTKIRFESKLQVEINLATDILEAVVEVKATMKQYPAATQMSRAKAFMETKEILKKLKENS